MSKMYRQIGSAGMIKFMPVIFVAMVLIALLGTTCNAGFNGEARVDVPTVVSSQPLGPTWSVDIKWNGQTIPWYQCYECADRVDWVFPVYNTDYGMLLALGMSNPRGGRWDTLVEVPATEGKPVLELAADSPLPARKR